MPTVTGAFSGGSGASNIRIALEVYQESQTATDVTVRYILTIYRVSGTGFFNAGSGNSSFITTGTPTGITTNNFSYDFRSGSQGNTYTIRSATRTINTNSSTTISFSATAADNTAGIGTATTSTGSLTIVPDTPTPYFPPFFPYFPFFPFFPPYFPPYFPPFFAPAPSWVDQILSTTSTIENQSYSDGVSASNTTSYSVASGSLPSGITLNTSTGAISGTADDGSAGTYDFTIQASGSGGSITTQTLTLTVVDDGGKMKVYNNSTSTWQDSTVHVYNSGTSSWVKSDVYVYDESTETWRKSK